jgi:chorismate mutase
MQQLKNSGAFRLIRSRAVADSIANYDVNVRNALRQSEVEETIIQDYRQAAAKVFNANIFDEMMDDNLNVIKRPQGNPALANFTLVDLQNWNYKMYSIKGINRANRRDTRLLLHQAKTLLATLKKEYDIK